MGSEEVCLKWSNFSSSITKNIDELWKSDNYVDVTIYSEGKFIQAHKIILSASSKTFKNIFDFNPSQNPVIVLQDVKYRELSSLITFIYEGEVNIEQQNLPDLLKAAQTLQICGLFDSVTRCNTNDKQTDSEKPSKKRKIESESNKINENYNLQSNTATTSIQKNKISKLETSNDGYNIENNKFNTEVFIKTENDDDNDENSIFLSSQEVEEEEEEISSKTFMESINEFDPTEFTSSSNYIPMPREVAHGAYTEDLDLLVLLSRSMEGQSVLKIYNQTKNLSNDHRKIIVNNICEYWIQNFAHVKPSDYVKAAFEIKKLFPTENEQVYLNGKKRKGILAQKYYNLRRKYKSIDFSKDKTSGNNVEISNQEVIAPISEYSVENFEWLKENFSPHEIVLEKWNTTFNLRRNHVKYPNIDMFNEWPILKQPVAVELIELDFDKIYPYRKELLFQKWASFSEKTLPILSRDIKDRNNRAMLSNFQDLSTTNDSRDFIIFNSLFAIIKPSYLRANLVCYRPTILEAQNCFAIHINDKRTILQVFENKKEEYPNKDWYRQPTIFVIGDTVYNLKEFGVYLNGIFYYVPSFLKTVSLTLQMHKVLNVEHAPQTLQMWQFIEKYFYEFKINDMSHKIISFLSEIDNVDNH